MLWSTFLIDQWYKRHYTYQTTQTWIQPSVSVIALNPPPLIIPHLDYSLQLNQSRNFIIIITSHVPYHSSEVFGVSRPAITICTKHTTPLFSVAAEMLSSIYFSITRKKKHRRRFLSGTEFHFLILFIPKSLSCSTSKDLSFNWENWLPTFTKILSREHFHFTFLHGCTELTNILDT